MPDTERVEAERTPDELIDLIRQFSDADWVRLQKAARAFARSCPLEQDDLLQEAIQRALESIRTCPADVHPVRFLAEAMRSIADSERQKSVRKPRPVALVSQGEDEAFVDPPDPTPGAEERLSNAQEVAAVGDALLHLFADDEVAQLILEGRMEGMQGEDLMELVEIDKTTYESKCRLIRRRIDKRFPQGWPS